MTADQLSVRLNEYQTVIEKIVGILSATHKEQLARDGETETKTSEPSKKEKKAKKRKMIVEDEGEVDKGNKSTDDDASHPIDPWGRKAALKKKKMTVETSERKKELLKKLHEKIEMFKSKRDQEKAARRKKLRESKRERREHNQKHGNNLLVKGPKKQIENSESESKDEETKVDKTNPEKPVIVENGKFIYSKFDFISADDSKNNDHHASKKARLKKNLHKIRRTEKLVDKLVEEGKADKAQSIKEKTAWKNALDRAEGAKVRDDPNRIVKSLKKQVKIKKKHAKEWADRKQQVEEKINKKQDRRKKNIQNKIDEKKKKKMKKLRKKGKLID